MSHPVCYTIRMIMKEKTYEVNWAYGMTTFINANSDAHAWRVARSMGKANGLGKVQWVLLAEVAKMVDDL